MLGIDIAKFSDRLLLNSGSKMDYQIFTCNNGSEAEYLVLSSGLGGHGAFWQPQVDFFRQYFHVVIYDQDGCHADSMVLNKLYSMQDLALQLFTIIQQANIEKFHFIGHALGGFIGAELARLVRYTEISILSLTVLNGWHSLDPHTRKCFNTRIALLEHAGVEAYVEAQALFLYPPAWISENIDVLRQQEQLQIQNFPPKVNVFIRLQALMQYQLLDETLQALKKIPVYLIANQDDFLVPFHQSQALAAQLPNAVFKLIKSGGHAATVTEKDQMNHLMLSLIQNQYEPEQSIERV